MTETAAFRPDRHRNQLISLARIQLVLAGPVRKKLDASDLVQEVLLRAHEARRQFDGTTAAEYAGWLRQILKNKLADAQRRYGRKKRDAGKEVSIDDSAYRMGQIAADQTSPSQHVARLERILLLAEALTALPEDQRTAVELHHIADLSRDCRGGGWATCARGSHRWSSRSCQVQTKPWIGAREG